MLPILGFLGGSKLPISKTKDIWEPQVMASLHRLDGLGF